MPADRSQPGSQRPDDAPQPSGGCDDAPTVLPIQPTSSMPLASRDLLFGRLALVNGFVGPEPVTGILPSMH
jgi:hypothetical protein